VSRRRARREPRAPRRRAGLVALAGSVAILAAVACLALTMAGCTAASGNLALTALGPPPPSQGATAPAVPPPPAPAPPQAACTVTGSFRLLSFLENVNLSALDQHANPDGSTDTRSLVAGRQVDPAASQLIGVLGSTVGLLAKGGAAAATGGALRAVPQPDGSLRLVRVAPDATPSVGQAASPPAGQASVAGCVPRLSTPAGSVGGVAAPAGPASGGASPPRRPSAYLRGRHAGRDGRMRWLEQAWPDAVWYRDAAGRRHVLDRAAWERLVP
jgi:hypothetical protein